MMSKGSKKVRYRLSTLFSAMNCRGNGTIIINKFLEFRANELNWGMGMPLYTFPNELTDMVKLWQPVSGDPVQIIFGGYAAIMMKNV